MAQMTSVKMSTDLLLNAHFRCTRLKKSHDNGIDYLSTLDKLVPQMTAAYTKVKSTIAEGQYALDEANFCDFAVDTILKNLASDCQKLDRINFKGRVYERCFPGKIPSRIYNGNREEQTYEVDRIVATIKSLGEEHELYAYVEPLEKGNLAVRDAIFLYRSKLSAYNKAKSDEVTLRQTFCAEYAVAYYVLASKVGRIEADKYFPRLRDYKKVLDVELQEEQ